MDRENLFVKGIDGNPYYVVQRPNGKLVNLSYLNEPVQDVESVEPYTGFNRGEGNPIKVFTSASAAYGAINELKELKPEYYEELDSLTVGWLLKSFVESGIYNLVDYTYGG